MGGEYYYFPITSAGRSRMAARDTDHDRAHAITTRPETPSLSRGSSPSSSGPATPPPHPVILESPKVQRRNVAFASPVSEARRRAEWDELSVMRAFASHAAHCESCADPLAGQRRGTPLCNRGTGLAKDLGTYFYCFNGKPHSVIDKQKGRERVQVEVPSEYSAVRRLFEALDKGLNLRRRPKPPRPEIRQSSPYQEPPYPPVSRRQTMEPVMPSRHRYEDEPREIRPARTDSQRQRDTVYHDRGGRTIATRSPYDGRYAVKSKPSYPYPRILAIPTTGRYHESRSRDDTYYDRRHESYYPEHRPRDPKRHSYHAESEPRKPRYPTYRIPSFSSFWR
jgi:hypothetical protein